MCVALVMVGARVVPASAGAWPTPEGELHLIFPVTITNASQAYDASGKLVSHSHYDKTEVSPYAEYGLTKSLALMGELSYIHDHTRYYIWDFSQSSFARAEAGARLSLGTWQDTRFSIQARGIFHFATAGDDPYASRNGDIDTQLDLVMGRSFTILGVEGFSDSQTGYKWKPRGLPAEVDVNLTIGIKPWRGTMLLLKSESYASIGGSSSVLMKSVTASKVGLSWVQDLTPSVAFELGVMQTVTGRNIIRERSVRLGFWYKF